jgi:hypothetical protein
MHFWDNNQLAHTNESQPLIALANKIANQKSGNTWYLITTTDPDQHTYTMQTLHDWHIILGHTNPHKILQLCNENLVKGLKITKTNTINLDPHFDCVGCIQGRAHVQPFGNTHIESPRHIGNIIYSDIWGPASKLLLQGNKYYIIFVDAAT